MERFSHGAGSAANQALREPSIIKLFLAEAAIELGQPRNGARVAELVKAQSSVARVTVR